MGPGVLEQWARHDDLIDTTITDIHHKIIRAYPQTTLGPPRVQPKVVIAIQAPKSAEDAIDVVAHKRNPSGPQISPWFGSHSVQMGGTSDHSGSRPILV